MIPNSWCGGLLLLSEAGEEEVRDQGDHHLPVPQALGDDGAGHVSLRSSPDNLLLHHPGWMLQD